MVDVKGMEAAAREIFESDRLFNLTSFKVLNQPAHKPAKKKNGNYMSVSRMPWIPAKIGKTKLDESFYFKEMMVARQDKGRLGLQLHWLLNQIFPYYLPKRYHQMDCRALQEKSPGGWYWSNASFYMMCTQAHGSLFMNEIYELLRKPNPDFKNADLNPYLPAKIRKQFFEWHLDLCESADEILFDPWLILQLPYNAGLLQQWLVAFIAELFLFTKEMVELYFMSVPIELEPVIRELSEIVVELTDQSSSLYKNLLKSLVEGDPTGQTAFYLAGGVRNFEAHIGNTLSMLRFITSKECKDMIKALKCVAWNGRNKTTNRYDAIRGALRHGDLYRFMASGDVDHVYSYKFWLKDKLGIPKFEQMGPPGPFSNQFSTHIELAYEVEIWKSIRQLKESDVFNFMSEKVIKAGKLKGASPERMMRELKGMDEEDYKFAGHCLLMYQHFLPTSSESPGVRDADFGVIYQLNSLFADVHLAVAQSALVEICEWAINSRGRLQVYKNMEADGEVVTMPVDSMLKTLHQARQDKSWSCGKLLERIRTECKKGNEASKQHPILESGIDKIVQNLEARIKNLLLKMIEGQWEQFKGPKRLYAEMSAVQYILPCFVASFVEMYQDPSVSEPAKRQYMRFVNEMVKTYERCEYYESHRKHHHLSNLTTELLDTYGPVCLIKRVSSDVDKVLPKVLNLLPTYTLKNLQNLFQVIFFFYIASRQCECVEYNIAFTCFSWPLQLYFLFSRLRAALEVVSPETFASIDLTLNNCYKAFLFTATVQNLEIQLPEEDSALTISILSEAKYRWRDEHEEKPETLHSFKSTTMEQLIGIVLFTYLSNLKKAANWRKPQLYDFVKRFFLDPVQNTYFNMLEGDMWKVKLMTSKWLSRRDGKHDLSIITLEEARKQDDCYQIVLATLTKDGKVPMVKSGQVTFCPVQHCRWCGKAEGVKEFKLCDVCLENPDYPDKNYYCSDMCMEAMKEQHIEEHAQFCILKLIV